VDDILRRLGQRIREIRIQRGFGSQEKFADYCHMHRTFLGHLETGRKDFRLTTVIRVADALGVTLQDLFAGIEAGETFKTKKATPKAALNMERISKEIATLERSIQKLREIADQPRRLPRAAKSARGQTKQRN
jgi:transcriptional regulator with XRE-family HTH domain